MKNRISVANIENPSTKFEQWLVQLEEQLKKEYKNRYPSLEWNSFEYSKGRKYTKIYRDGSIWGFVAMQDVNTKNKSFKKGDLLKAAGRGTPAKHARGNIFEGTGRYTLYGPEYLK